MKYYPQTELVLGDVIVLANLTGLIILSTILMGNSGIANNKLKKTLFKIRATYSVKKILANNSYCVNRVILKQPANNINKLCVT